MMMDKEIIYSDQFAVKLFDSDLIKSWNNSKSEENQSKNKFFVILYQKHLGY